ncbi:MAG TPA: Calx-beta domain-containing protein [Solirubrobacteraceae bacterium]|nr:Calx-beta domain-containing protein [Solirubrobacteraceae bacterium]
MLLRRTHHVVAIAAALAALIVIAAPAAASPPSASPSAATGVHQVGKTLNVWGVGVITQGLGAVGLKGPLFVNQPLDEHIDLGPAAFKSPASQRLGRATGTVLTENGFGQSLIETEAPTLDPHQPGAVKGSYTFLDQYRDYRKDVSPQKQSVQIKLDQVLLDMIDANGQHLTAAECPVVGTPGQRCSSIRTSAKVEVVAYQKGAQHPFFEVGGTIYAEGHEHAWFVGAGTSSVSMRPFWDSAEFDVNGDFDQTGSGRHLKVDNGFRPLTITIPLDSVRFQHTFDVRVSLDVRTVDDRGLESAAAARIVDPQRIVPSGSATRAVQRVSPKFKVPPAAPRPAARCPKGPSARAGQLQLGSQPVTVGEASGTALVMVTRTGGSRGATSAVVRTSGGSARSGRDFTATRTLVRFESGDTSPRIVEIPILEDRAVESPESFQISLTDPRCARLGQRRAATAMILDDDQPAPPPAPTFTIGGTVDGLQGSGLVLSNLGTELPVSANGSFTLPGTHSVGERYEVNVKSQPRNPDQVCTVENGAGHATNANVTKIAVHCQTSVIPSGLDTTFGSGGRVTTPGNGDGNAVLIQPDGHIITVGPREVGVNFHFQFGATRHDSAGNLDPSFGTGGVVTTSLGGNDDKAFDAALTSDGGFVAVGQADPAGLANTDFGIVRYTANGQPNPAFGTGGIVRSDLFGRDDVANAVAVQPDGKIVAAGLAETTPSNFDFALVRYNPDGTLDHSFGGDGIVTTDLGTFHDGITDIALQPDGKIVAVGATDQDAVLARYNPDGTLDPTFGTNGTTLGGINTNEVHGVAITPDGTILIAGSRGGPNGLDPIVASYAPNGKLNLGFGQSGVAQADLSGGTDLGDDLLVKPNGDIILVGSAASTTVSDMALVRFKPDGTLDTFLAADLSGFGDFGHALAIDSQGRIVAAGTAGGFALMRALL